MEQRRRAAIPVDTPTLEAACVGLDRAYPHRSARRVFYITQIAVLLALTAAMVWSLRIAPGPALTALHYGALALFACAILVRLVAAGSLSRVMTRLASPQTFPVYTILCPLHREANIVPDLVQALGRIDYPPASLDIKFLVEADDPETVEAALAATHAPHFEVVAIPPAKPRTKPKALNIGLSRARGEFVVVFDAEDRPHPQQLRAALAAFEEGGPELACVQAPLTIDNPDASWIARQFAAEYAIQFREILPLLARNGLPLPLGGSSNHFRTQVLRDIGGWDAFNVTEDADIGYRLARDGFRSSVIGPPTAEEAPVSFSAWLNQRTRWIKGHMQTWLVLMRDPLRTAREMGVGAFLAMQLIFAGGIVAAFVHGPLAFIILMDLLSPYSILGHADFVLALAGYCVAIFAALTASALSGQLSHARAAFTMPFYWPLSSLAAYRALFELLLRPHHWAKTAHGVSKRPASHP